MVGYEECCDCMAFLKRLVTLLYAYRNYSSLYHAVRSKPIKPLEFGNVTLVKIALRRLENKHSGKQELTSHVR